MTKLLRVIAMLIIVATPLSLVGGNAIAATAPAGAPSSGSTTTGPGPMPPLPPVRPADSPLAVAQQHFAAVNSCDWTTAMELYAGNAQVLLPDGSVTQGRQAIGQLLWNFLASRADGGFCGIDFATTDSTVIGTAVAVQYSATASFFTAPYLGAESVDTQNGLIVATVSTTRAQDFPLADQTTGP